MQDKAVEDLTTVYVPAVRAFLAGATGLPGGRPRRRSSPTTCSRPRRSSTPRRGDDAAAAAAADRDGRPAHADARRSARRGDRRQARRPVRELIGRHAPSSRRDRAARADRRGVRRQRDQRGARPAAEAAASASAAPASEAPAAETTAGHRQGLHARSDGRDRRRAGRPCRDQRGPDGPQRRDPRRCRHGPGHDPRPAGRRVGDPDRRPPGRCLRPLLQPPGAREPRRSRAR